MAGFTQQPDDALRALADRLVDHYAQQDPTRSEGTWWEATSRWRHGRSIEHVFDGRMLAAGASCSAVKTLRTWRILRARGFSLLDVWRGWS